jgi:hypothetical protein
LARRRLPFSLRRKWVYLALPVIAGLVFFLWVGLPYLSAPRLSKSQQQWQEFSMDVPPGHPLDVVSHGYRMIRAYRREAPVSARGPSRNVQIVEWEWKMAVKNKTNRDMEVFANYYLADRDHLMVDVDSAILQKPAPSGKTVAITHQTEMVYEDLLRVATGVWEISWEEGKSARKIRRKGF